MNKENSLKVAAIILFVFGIFEVMGVFALFIPEEYLPGTFEGHNIFWSALSGIYGISRLVAGYAVWKKKKWGIALTVLLCLTTMIVAPSIIPFGIIDLILALIILVLLLYAYFGNDEIQ